MKPRASRDPRTTLAHRFSRWRIARVTGRASFYRGDERAIVPRVNVTKCYRLSDLGGVTPSAPSETIAPRHVRRR